MNHSTAVRVARTPTLSSGIRIYMQDSWNVSLRVLVAPATPALGLALALNLDEDIHVPLTEVLQRPTLSVTQAGVARADDVDDPEDALRVALGVIVGVTVGMLVRGVVVADVVVFVMSVVMTVMMVMIVGMLVLGSVLGVVEPESRNGVSNNAANRVQSAKGISNGILNIGRQGKQQCLGRARDKRNGRKEDENGDDTGR